MSLPGLDFYTWSTKRSLNAANENKTILEPKQLDNKPNCFKPYENSWWQCFTSSHNRSNIKMIYDSDTRPQQPKVHMNVMEAKLGNNNVVNTEIVQIPVPRRVLSVRRQVSREVQTRALVYDVAQYYQNYVNEMNLQRYFHNDTLVTCVKPITSSTNKNVRWLVRGIHSNGTLFAYCCQNVVLANGASDLANRLEVNGEGSTEWVKHDLPALVSDLEKIPDTERSSKKLSRHFIKNLI